MPAQVIRGRGRRFLLFEEWKAYCRLGAPAAHACCSLPRASHPATRQPAQTTSIEKHSPACSARHCTLATHSLTCLTPSAHLTRPLPPSAVRADRGIAVADAHPRALHHRGGAARRLPAAAGLRARALAVLRVLPLTRPDSDGLTQPPPGPSLQLPQGPTASFLITFMLGQHGGRLGGGLAAAARGGDCECATDDMADVGADRQRRQLGGCA